MSAKRWSVDSEFHGKGVLVGDPGGGLVYFEDYQKLEAENAALRNRIAELEAAKVKAYQLMTEMAKNYERDIKELRMRIGE